MSPSRQSSSSKYKCDFIDSKCFHVKMVVEMISARQLGPDEKLLQIEAQVYNLVRLYDISFSTVPSLSTMIQNSSVL